MDGNCHSELVHAYEMGSGKGFRRASEDSLRSWLGGETYKKSLGNEEFLDEGLEPEQKEREVVKRNGLINK